MAEDIARIWRGAIPAATATLRYSFLHDGVLRAVLCEIGKRAGWAAVYWGYGACFYDAETQAVLRIRSELPEREGGDWITVESAGDHAPMLARVRGEEWSEAWGGSEAQWFGCLYPRLHRFLRVGNLLEIAPGFGRWTHYLLVYVQGRYTGVDLSQACVEYCKDRFSGFSNTAFLVNDGLSLDNVEDGLFDLVFSFDSLAHTNLDVHQNYIPQILRKLTQNGVAFIHHSN